MGINQRLTVLFESFPGGSRYEMKYNDKVIKYLEIGIVGTDAELSKLQKFVFNWMGILPKILHSCAMDCAVLTLTIRENRPAIERLVNCLEEYQLAQEKSLFNRPVIMVEGIPCIKLDLSGHSSAKYEQIKAALSDLTGLHTDHACFNQVDVVKCLDPQLLNTIRNWGATDEQLKNICAVLEKDSKFVQEIRFGQQIYLPKIFFKYFSNEIDWIISGN